MVSVAKPQCITAILKRLAFAVTCSFLFSQAWLKFSTNLQRPPRGRPSQFAIDFERDSFMLAGEPVRILSGSLHYFRTPRELWMERLNYARAAGLNTIDTFVEWSSHEPEEGLFDFRGQRDLVSFLEMAHNLSLMVILRPGPYIGAERDMGGLPYWLLRKDPGIRLRTMDTTYIQYVDRYLVELFRRVRHLLMRNGGPIIMVQVENKYGLTRQCNRTYLRHLRDLMLRELGSDTALFTTDRVGAGAVSCGWVEGVFPAMAFGAVVNVSEVFAKQRLNQKRGPLFVSELYTGSNDRWAMAHRHMDHAIVASTLRRVLLAGASVNLYMFHGGTSFGFSSGASMVAATGRKNEFLYRPQVTSYDFGGPLTEDGDPSKLFTAVRRVISEMFGIAGLQHIARGRSVSSQHPLSFEEVGHAHGLMLYDATVTYQPHEPAVLRVEGIRDSGYVYVDGVFVDSLSRAEKNTAVIVKAKLHQVLTILVHNEGRMSSGKAMGERKGIVYNVTLDKLLLTNWTMRPVPLTNASWLTDYDQMRSIRKQIPLKGVVSSSFEVRVFAAEFEIPYAEPYDTFLRPDQKTKGIAFLNGFNLGRYWPARGPQKTLYVPRTLFRKKNVLVLIELEGGFHRGGRAPVVHFEDEPELLGTVHKMDE